MLRVAILYDVCVRSPDGRLLEWAYARRARSLAEHAPADFDVTIASSTEAISGRVDISEPHLIFLLEYTHALHWSRIVPTFATKPPLVVSHNSDHQRRMDLLDDNLRRSHFIVCNNKSAWETFGRQPKTCCISNGVDERWWQPDSHISERPHRVLWCGSSNPKKQKGYELLLAAQTQLENLGFECSFRPIDNITPDIVLDREEQRRWYNSGSYVVCMSQSEATPGISLEGGACGCVLVTTKTGNVLEFGEQNVNCVLIDRDVKSLVSGLCYAREHRDRLSAAIMRTMQSWSYGPPGNRAACYFDLFRNLINRNSVKPFSYDETEPGVFE